MMRSCLCDNQDSYLVFWPKRDAWWCLQCHGVKAKCLVDREINPVAEDKVYEPVVEPAFVRYLTNQDIQHWPALTTYHMGNSHCYIGLVNYQEAIVMPITSVEGNFVYYSARYLAPHDLRHKYAYPKNSKRIYWRMIYSDLVFICEGVADAIRMSEFGSAVALLGMHYDGSLDELLKGRKLVVCFDGDVAGIFGSVRLCDTLWNKGFQAQLLTLPPGKDPTDLDFAQVCGILKSQGVI